MSNKETTIRVKETTKERLKDIGRMGETMDELLNRIIDKFKGLKRVQ